MQGKYNGNSWNYSNIANSGYGYIKTNLENGKVERFVEKPDELTAKQYLENAIIIGMLEFLFLELYGSIFGKISK